MNRRELILTAGAATLLADLAAGEPARPLSQAARHARFLAELRLGPVQSGAGNHRWAAIADGVVVGGAVEGRVQSGSVDWHVDPMSGAFSVSVFCQVRGADGVSRELRSAGVEVGAADFSRGRVQLRAANQG